MSQCDIFICVQNVAICHSTSSSEYYGAEQPAAVVSLLLDQCRC